MHLPQPTESSFSPPPAGTHLAICYRIVDLGTQQTAFNGETKLAHQVLISWELPDEHMDDGRPFTLSRRFTWSMHEKASLRKFLETWRGAAFKETDFGPGGFDIRKLLGRPCTLSVVHTEKGGTVYANIAGVGKPMKGVQVPAQTNQSIYLWMAPERWDTNVFAALSAGLQATITKSPEYHDLMRAIDRSSGQSDGAQHPAFDDEIPF